MQRANYFPPRLQKQQMLQLEQGINNDNNNRKLNYKHLIKHYKRD